MTALTPISLTAVNTVRANSCGSSTCTIRKACMMKLTNQCSAVQSLYHKTTEHQQEHAQRNLQRPLHATQYTRVCHCRCQLQLWRERLAAPRGSRILNDASEAHLHGLKNNKCTWGAWIMHCMRSWMGVRAASAHEKYQSDVACTAA